MTTGEIIFSVMVAIQGLLFLIGLNFFIALIKSKDINKSGKFGLTAVIIWGASNIFPLVGVLCYYLL